MSILNKLIDHGSKFILIIIGLAVALLPIIHIFANERLHHQQWNPAFQKFQHRLTQIQDISRLQLGYIFLNSTQKNSVSQVQDTLQLADYICYNLIQNGEAVVRKILQIKTKRKAKKGQQAQNNQEIITVSTLLQNPPLSFLKTEISKFINFEHQSLKSKHWVIVSFGELQDSIKRQIETIKKINPQYKFTVVSSKQISTFSIEKQLAGEPEEKEKRKNGKEKKSAKVKKVKVIEGETEKSIQIPQEEKPIQQNEL